MSKVSARQRQLRQGQPYTRVATNFEPVITGTDKDGKQIIAGYVMTGYRTVGFTLEYVLKNKDSGEWVNEWEEHDLGIKPTLGEAHDVASDWRKELVGQYELVA
jgi:hypothetical protein